MASGCCLLLCLLVVLSVSLTPGHCGYQKIDLTQASCNVSSKYNHADDCSAAINGKTDTTHHAGVNCVYTEKQPNQYWLVNLGQPRNIHRIIIYPETFERGRYMKSTRVLVDELEIGQLPSFRPITTRQVITNNLPVRGQIIKLTRDGVYTTLCELQVEECTTDTHGADCTLPCSGGCNENGGDRTCDSINGTCFAGCQEGWLRPQCDKQCPQECKVPCDTNTGNCPECKGNFILPDCRQCKPGWYGVRCDAPCSPHCKSEVGGDIKCQQSSGVCDNGCESGWYRPNCTVPCPANCEGGCQKDDGVCNECKASWYGSHCEKSCSTNCKQDTTGNITCQKSDGVCTSGCKTGFFGPRCELSCGKGCIDNTCNKQDGTCNCSTGWSSPSCTECDSGYYGEGSCEDCSDHCLGEDVCNNTNGHCPRGCDSGFDGDRCDRCNGTLWGPDCSLSCGQCGGDGSCDMLTGHCVDSGCLQGFRGDNCTLAVTAEEETADNSMTTNIVVGIVVAVVVVAVAVGAAIFLRRRKRMAKDGDSHDTNVLHPVDSMPSNQFTDVTSDGEKADKPLAHVKPLNRASLKAAEPQGGTGHVYSNASALAYPGTSGAAPAKSAGNNRPPKPASKPAKAAKPTPAATAGPIYENFTVPNGGDVTAATEKAPGTAVRKSGGGRLKKTQTDEDFNEVDEDDVYNSEDLYASYTSLSSTQQLDPFQRYLIARLASGELEEEFDNLPKGMKHPHAVGLSEENKRKNRFKALCTYDFNRVILHKPEGDNSSDYINATYIKGCQRDKQYIATQGPRANTIDDLWWMVWQEGITQLVMLANLQEDGKDKCEEYWPAAGKSQTYGHVTVRGLEEHQRADYAIRSFVLKASGRERHVTQYHYMAWPDHGVPLAASLVDYWRYVKARTTSTVPLLVHCSAGVGRTGTFIALDIASEKESRGEDVNVNEIVTKLREQRALMVQSEAQYKFLHEVVLEAHTGRATRVTVSQFDFIFPDNIEVKKDNSRIDKEFQMLKQMGQFAKPSSSMATMPENLDKNRNMDALPDDEHVVYLSAYVRGRTQYINAVYLPSFYHRHGFVLTQLPIPNNTLIDFWRLVDGCQVTKIVSLGSDHEQETVKNFCQYWPLTSGEVLTTGPYSVTMDASNRLGTFLHSYRLILKSENNDSSREVEVLQYKDWAGEVPSDTSSLLHLVDTVKAKQSDDVTAPIIVQCIDGAAKSGLFAVLCDVISRVTHDDEVDVYLTAREVQRIRPQAVATQTQYRYLYKAAQEYIRHVGVYANSGVR